MKFLKNIKMNKIKRVFNSLFCIISWQVLIFIVQIEEEISLYAYENKTDISELLAESYTRKKLGKTNLLIEYIINLYELGEWLIWWEL